MARSATKDQVLKSVARIVAAIALFHVAVPAANAARLDEMSLDRWAKVREVERYQLNIAEKYYREKNYKVAMTEYEKFLTLYESSEAAPYSLLKWSLCQVILKKPNTAIKDGFQSIIDYWPDSPEALASAYYIGNAYKNMGEIRKAKKAYQEVVKDHSKHLVAVLSLVDLVDLAAIDKDEEAQVSCWKQLTFEMPRTKESKSHCERASQYLATYTFLNGRFTDGVAALETTYKPEQMPTYVLNYARTPISQLTGDPDDKVKGERLADQAVAWVKQQVPAGTSEEEKKLAKTFWFVAADLMAASRRPDKVAETYDQIGKRFGVDDETRGRLAAWLKTEKQYDKARIEYGKFENKIEGNNQIAYSFRQEAKYDLAVTAYQRNLSLDPDNQVKWKELIAYAYRDGKKHAEALAVLDELRNSDLDNTEKWIWQIAYTHHHYTKDNKQAIAWYRQSTNFPGNYQAMADCNRRMKKHNEAIILYKQVMSDKRYAPWALMQIGLTQEEAGKKELAIGAFQQVCKLFPKDGHASQAHARLQDKYKITVTLGGAKDE